ncbi:MAG: hypothetical protein JSV88_13345 [Candidatus Aminicenantes bacterium]|nr:MAG: hypothetical protein JSV88_13345 [Candidatus Aminicenantes bacterium]
MPGRNLSFADVLNAAEVMEAGIRKYVDRLSKRGLNEQYIDGYYKGARQKNRRR